ncbi:MAG: ATP-binding cassette domain-containing protein [Atopobiaceae bacterium]|nr:ATP-binding cassette domain-containing protein [Atopobiaceae bacterium]
MKAYQHVDLELSANKAHAICAQDKSGKSELLLTFAGLMKPSSGSCHVFGQDVSRVAGRRNVRKQASLAFFEHVNDVERVLRVRTIASAELGLAGKPSNRAATMAFLTAWDLGDYADSTVESLSRYDYDRLGIALAMAHDPALLLVDDIERDLTEHESIKLCHLLCSLAAQQNITVVCGVLDYDLASRFDTASCITDEARAQQAAWSRKHVKDVA